MEGVTLLESGASREHFALVKKLEGTENAAAHHSGDIDAQLADTAISAAVEQIRKSLQAKDASSFSPATLSSHFVVLLHCVSHHATRISLDFALVPALHLVATATRPQQLHVAHTILQHILLGDQQEDAVDGSLLLLNTTRSHLLASLPASSSSTLSSSSSSSSAYSSRRRTSSANDSSKSKALRYAQTYFALSSILSGLPSGPDVVPALFGPTLSLVGHRDAKLSALAIDALAKFESYVKDDDSVAIAAWERTKTVIAAEYGTGEAKGKARARKTAPNLSLLKPCLRSIRKASLRGYWDVERSLEALCQILDGLGRDDADHALVRATSEAIAQVAALGNPKPYILEKAAVALVDAFGNCQSTYSTALGIVRALGALQSRAQTLDPPHALAPKNLDAVWNAVRCHLKARNANRKILVLGLLDALIPFGNLDEAHGFGADEVGQIVSLLGDMDSTVRRRTLHLLNQVDPDLLLQHQDHLKGAMESASTLQDRIDLGVRWIETVYERMRYLKRGLWAGGKGFGIALVDLAVQFHKLDYIEETVVSSILSLLRTAPTSFARIALHPFLFRLEEDFFESASSPTAVMMVASLICEFAYNPDEEQEQDDIDQDDEEMVPTKVKGIEYRMFDKMASILTVTASPVLQEALLVAMVRLTLTVAEIPESSVATVRKVLEHASSGLVQARAKQFISFSDDLQRSSLVSLPPRPTLTETLDAFDRHFAATSAKVHVGSTSTARTNTHSSSPAEVRPLRYEAYDDVASSQTPMVASQQRSSGSFGGPQTMPKPSDERQRLRAKTKREEKLRLDMEASIRRLTLGPEDEPDEEHEGQQEQGEQGHLILFDADQPSVAPQEEKTS